MTTLAPVTAAIAAVLNGVAAGIMLSTVVGIVPMMLAEPYRGYVRMVQFMWPRFDPLMPTLNTSALVLAAFSAVAAGGVPARPVLATAATLLAVVVTISVTKNVPVNRFIGGLDPERQPANWSEVDPRRRWRRWNLIRTTIAVLAFALNVTGTALMR